MDDDLGRRPSRGYQGVRQFLGGHWLGGQVHRDTEPARIPSGEGEGSVVRLGDALDDCESETDAGVVGADAFTAALERLGKGGDCLWGELLAGVLDGEHSTVGVSAGGDPDGARFGQVVDD